MAPQKIPGLSNRFAYASVGLIVAGTTTGLAASTSAYAAEGSVERPAAGAHLRGSGDVHTATVKALHAVARHAAVARPTTVAPDHVRAFGEYRVRPGDTLSGIARRQLGEAKRYREIFNLNRGKPQPDGGRLTHANLIEPGWILELPGEAQAHAPVIAHAPAANPCPVTLPGSDPCGQQPSAYPKPFHKELGTPVRLAVPGASRHAPPAVAAHPAAPGAVRATSRWSAPITGQYTISESYGVANSRYAAGRHTGVDLAVPVGTPIHAVSTGTVVFAGWGGSYGNLIKLRDSDGRYSLYAHLSRIDVSVGDQVDAGHRLALSGASGNVTGPHLHFEIDTTLQYGSDINPGDYLAAHGVHL